jgi:hypothetical protein
MGEVISINKGQKQVARELSRQLQQMKDDTEKNGTIPYSDWIVKMNEQFMIREAGNLFIQAKLKGMVNEEATIFAKDKAKAEGIKHMALEMLKTVSFYKEKQLTNAHINKIEIMCKDFVRQVDFMEKNPRYKFTHFLTDMEMIHEMNNGMADKINNIINDDKE